MFLGMKNGVCGKTNFHFRPQSEGGTPLRMDTANTFFDTIPQIALDLVTKIGRQEIQKHATARRPHQKYTKYLQRKVQNDSI